MLGYEPETPSMDHSVRLSVTVTQHVPMPDSKVMKKVLNCIKTTRQIFAPSLCAGSFVFSTYSY